jgi:hypothetical protein
MLPNGWNVRLVTSGRMLGKVLNAIALISIGVLFGHAVLVSIWPDMCLLGC